MAIVKFVATKCPMSYIFKYVMRKEATERKLIDGVNCSPASAMEEFIYTKQQFQKEDGRQYYHIVQSFSPDDQVTPELAHQIGLEFAACFPGYQILVATHVNTKAVHNHLIMKTNSSGLVEMIGDFLCTIEDEPRYDPPKLNEMSQAEKALIEKILGRKITNTAFITYCTREAYEQEMCIRMG